MSETNIVELPAVGQARSVRVQAYGKAREAFWRDTPLSESEVQLLLALRRAHAIAAQRNNASTASLLNAAHGSGDYTKAIAAALMTLGGRHAPIEATMRVLTAAEPEKYVADLLGQGRMVPGWGNSFVKGKPDPDWTEVAHLLARGCPKLLGVIGLVTRTLHEAEPAKKVFPNPSCYTAAVALALDIPGVIAPWLFISSRLEAWTATLWKDCNAG